MRQLVLICLALGLFLPANVTFAQGGLKVGTVDMREVFQSYHRTKTAQEKLREVEDEAKAQLEKRLETYKALLEDMKRLEQEAQDESFSDEEKKKRETSFQEKAQEARNLEREITEFRNTRQKQIRDRHERMTRGLVGEIMETIRTKAEQENFNMVFDISEDVRNTYPLVIYSLDSYEMTAEIIQILNEDQGSEEG